MHDLNEDDGSPSRYECLSCGELVESITHPTDCPECGATLQSQANSLE
ncbi:MAG: rubrerythrin-like domain-containing protein [Haloarculaceae archaeon]